MHYQITVRYGTKRQRYHTYQVEASDARTALSALLRGDLWLDVESVLEEIGAPVFLAWGRSANAAPVENADLWLRRMPAAEGEIFQGSADLPHIESSTAFCRAVERFVGGLQA